MVRTKADAGSARVSAAKAPRKNLGGTSASKSSTSSGNCSNNRSGGNSYNPQPVPNWQKGIGCFFKADPNKNQQSNLDADSGTSKSSETSDSSE